MMDSYQCHQFTSNVLWGVMTKLEHRESGGLVGEVEKNQIGRYASQRATEGGRVRK